MELWVRSQEKTSLCKIEQLYMEYDNKNRITTNKYCIVSNNILLGIYKSKERALEVLDEIQERIINLQLVNLEEKGKAKKDVYQKAFLECVYRMPKD